LGIRDSPMAIVMWTGVGRPDFQGCASSQAVLKGRAVALTRAAASPEIGAAAGPLSVAVFGLLDRSRAVRQPRLVPGACVPLGQHMRVLRPFALAGQARSDAVPEWHRIRMMCEFLTVLTGGRQGWSARSPFRAFNLSMDASHALRNRPELPSENTAHPFGFLMTSCDGLCKLSLFVRVAVRYTSRQCPGRPPTFRPAVPRRRTLMVSGDGAEAKPGKAAFEAKSAERPLGGSVRCSPQAPDWPS